MSILTRPSDSMHPRSVAVLSCRSLRHGKRLVKHGIPFVVHGVPMVGLAVLLLGSMIGCSEETNPVYQSIRAPKPQQEQVAEEPASQQPWIGDDQPQAAGSGAFAERQQAGQPSYSRGGNDSPVFAASDQLAPAQSFSNDRRAGNSNAPTFAGAGNSGGASPPNDAPPRPGRRTGGVSSRGNSGEFAGGSQPGSGGPATGGMEGLPGSGQRSGGSNQDASQNGQSQVESGRGSYFNEARLLQPVALPQTGPNGTMMSFNIQYEFTKRRPVVSDQYFLVILGKRGFREEWHLTDLDQKGGFTAIVDGWKPEFGPFSASLEQSLDEGGLRERISAAVAFPE